MPFCFNFAWSFDPVGRGSERGWHLSTWGVGDGSDSSTGWGVLRHVTSSLAFALPCHALPYPVMPCHAFSSYVVSGKLRLGYWSLGVVTCRPKPPAFVRKGKSRICDHHITGKGRGPAMGTNYLPRCPSLLRTFCGACRLCGGSVNPT